MIPVPEELLEQVERGNVLLFIGERIVRDAEGQVVLDLLTARLADRCGIADAEGLAFPEVAQAYEDDKGRQALVQFLRDQLAALGDEPQQAHRLIAGLTAYCNVLITTCLNRRLERALEAVGQPLDVIIGNVDVAFEDERKAQLYKLRGSLERPKSLILTEDDHEAFFRNRANLSIVLQGYLARKTILFIGYDLADPLFRRLYCEVTAPLDGFARCAYAFGETPSPRVSRWCKRHGINVVEVDATAFLEALTRQLAARARPAPAARLRPVEEPAAPLPERPYKLLDYYEARDAGLFFGRQQETQTLSSLIHAHRLVLLYGASGVGKTSLLLAGALPRLERAEPPYETICVRALEDPARTICRAVRRRLPEVNLPEDGTLVDFLDAATKALGRTLVIVLDQFEEFFIRLSPQFRAAFITELGALYDARDVPVKVVLSLREDWLASVGEVEARIPGVFHTRMRLLPLARDQARQAITAPAERLGVSYERALVERLLDDLVGGEGTAVMPPQLQLVCGALYDGLAPGERRIAVTAYERLGGARGVLRQYLEDELARLAPDERALAHSVLEELVTSQGTKAVKAPGELALALDVDRSGVGPVLEKLVRARLLRALEREDGAIAYELAHEYLIREISLGAEAQARKAAEELLAQELDDRRRYGTLMSAHHLQRVAPYVQRLVSDNEVWDWLLCSALADNHDVTFWPAQHPKPGRAAYEVLSFLVKAGLEQKRNLVVKLAEELGRKDDDQQGWYRLLVLSLLLASGLSVDERREDREQQACCQQLVTRLKDNLALTDNAARAKAREILACIGPPAGLSWGRRMLVYLAGMHLLVPHYASQTLLFGFGGALGGLFSVVPLVPLGLWLGFLRPDEGQALVEAAVSWLLILGPGIGIVGLLIGLGLGLGVVLGRGQSFLLEAEISSMGGFLGGALVAGYLCLLDMFALPISPTVIMAAFAFVGALVGGAIVYLVRWVKSVFGRGQIAGQIIAGMAVGAAIGTLGDFILLPNTFPYTLVTGVCFGAGIAVGLSWAERRSRFGNR